MTIQETSEIARVIGIDADVLAGRHRAVQDALRFFTWDHLPSGLPRQVSGAFAALAGDLVDAVRFDDPELTRALSRLLEAKDAAVRAAIVAESEARQ